ncbi:mannosyl-3-phosphoglycerate synthase [Chloroflexota bacterium]
MKTYAAGFSMSASPYSMVRILWRYKPKFVGGLYFKKLGRASETTNKCLNSLLSAATGFETDIIKTGNAGEHAMSTKLAEILPYASGYAVEPQEIISILEQSGAVLPAPYPTVAKHGVDIFQIETKNPHLHEDKGTEHLLDMLRKGLSTIYHSQLANPTIKDMITAELVNQKALEPNKKLPRLHVNCSLRKIDLKGAQAQLQQRLDDYLISPHS